MILILIAIPADANFLNGYALNGSVLVGYVLKIRIGGICIGGIRLRFLLMHTFWMDTHWMDTHSMDTYWWDTCWTDTYWWDTYWWDTYCKTCWCKRFEWIRIAWIRTGGIRVERIRIGGIRFEWICVGYVWCDGYVWDMCGVRYVWDMCGVRYANNLLKNPATKRLSGKNLPSSCWRPVSQRFRTPQVRGWVLPANDGYYFFCQTNWQSISRNHWLMKDIPPPKQSWNLKQCVSPYIHIIIQKNRIKTDPSVSPSTPTSQITYLSHRRSPPFREDLQGRCHATSPEPWYPSRVQRRRPLWIWTLKKHEPWAKKNNVVCWGMLGESHGIQHKPLFFFFGGGEVTI